MSGIPQRPLGDTGLVVSRLGLGLAAVARPGYITLGRADDLPVTRTIEALYARSAALLDAAHAAGVRYFDVARSYGRAEEFLARWLDERHVPRASTTVGSKWGYRYAAGWRVDAPVHEEKELSLDRFTTQVAETQVLLGDRLDLYQIHSATVESGCLDDRPLLQALVECRRRGTCRAIGLTLSGAGSADTLARALQVRVDGERVFDTVQATFNCLEPSLAPALAEAHAAGVGVLVKEAFANGRLTPANQRADDAPLRRGLEPIAGRLACTLDQLALAFVLAHPFVDVVLSGAVTLAHLASHVGALDVALDRTSRILLAPLAETPERYWATRARLPWT